MKTSWLGRCRWAAAAGLGAIVLGGCGAVGDGNSIEFIELVPVGGVLDEADNRFHISECIPQGIAVIGYFSDGTRGTFTSRATFTSSDATVAEVSDGTVEAGIEGQFYTKGQILPYGLGTATLTADFVGLTASLDVEVDELGDVVFTQPDPTFGIDTIGLIGLEATINDKVVDVRPNALWSFAEPNEEIATIVQAGSAAGRVSGVAEGGPLRAQAEFPLCQRVLTTEVTIAPVDALTMEREFDGTEAVPPNGELVLGTSERFNTYATFASGAVRQDVTTQVSYESSDPQIAAFGAVGGVNYVLGVAAGGPVDVQAFFGDDDTQTEDVDERIASNVLPLTVVDVPLNGLLIAPTELELPAGCTYPLSAIGSFDGSRSQDITRHSVWTSEDSAVVSVSSTFASRGQVTATGEAGKSTGIAATYGEDMGTEDESDDVEITDTITVTVTESGSCPEPAD